MQITDFHTPGYQFLSNFAPALVEYEGLKYPTVEHAYAAAKTLNVAQRLEIQASSTPGLAKKNGRRVAIRKDWDAIKLNVMEFLLRQKFAPGTALAASLIATNPHQLIEGNAWGDRYWGMCLQDNNGMQTFYPAKKWVGENHLGKLLMQIRSDLLTEKLFSR